MDPIEIVKQLYVSGSAPTLLQPIICTETGRISGYKEQWNLNAEIAADASHSMSLNRAPDPQALGNVKGKRGNLPFLPGGLEDEIDKTMQQTESICMDEEQKFLDFEDLLTTPPTFQKSALLPDTLDEELKAKTFEFSTGTANKANDSAIDELLANDLSVETEARTIEKLCTTFKSVLISDKDEQVDQKDEFNEKDTNIESTITEAEDLSIKREGQAEFTHAKFLDEEKVAKKFEEIRPLMAKKYPFELDMFQKQAVVSMEANDSVFVAAHTSAGKTVVAEYAVALSKIHKTRVIYTSPIKALSNQKFREFKLLFGDVGLITGDIQLNTDAFCLIMTTEILRSMLYNGSEVIRELEWVIFDEVHYINDKERGYVWEESLIMLPSHVSIVMLSATVPNCIEFADWVGRIKQKQITVIQTFKRPVPLEHHIYTGFSAKTRNELFLLMDKDGNFLGDSYQEASIAKAMSNLAAGGKKKSTYTIDQNIYPSVVRHLKANRMLPVVFFIFSRKRCDDNASVLKTVNLTTEAEKFKIKKFFDKCIARLNELDRNLPQVVTMRELCERGFAIHHSGILPILKEIVELLFQQGLVKVLFATETFSMGVNMPARTVVFDAIEKFDGVSKRLLNATEYTQMAGRAGRRGLDDTGVVIMLVKQSLQPITSFQQLLKGKAVPLDSSFRVTYAMILKLLRVEQFRIEDMLQRSYVERSSLRLAVGRKNQIAELRGKMVDFSESTCKTCFLPGPTYSCASNKELFSDLNDYFDMVQEMWKLSIEVLLSKVLLKGRVLLISYPALGVYGQLAMLLNVKKTPSNKFLLTLLIPADESKREIENYQLTEFQALKDDDKLAQTKRCCLQYAATKGLVKVKEASKTENSYRVLYDFDPVYLLAICKSTIKKGASPDFIIKEDLKRAPSVRPRLPDFSIIRIVNELNDLAGKWAATEAPIYKFGVDIKPKAVYERMDEFISLEEKLLDRKNYPCVQCPLFDSHFPLYLDRKNLTNKLELLEFQTSKDALLLGDEHSNRINVLKKLEFVDKNGMIGLKGKVACEISNLELLVAELIFQYKFKDKSCPEIAAMLSPVGCQFGNMEKEFEVTFKNKVNDRLRDEITRVATKIDYVQKENKCDFLIMDELRFGLMDAMYEWASGTPFSEIMKVTNDCQEGLVVRCIQRLDEVLKDIRNCARIVGNPQLYQQMEETSQLIKRDIVFAASLYISDD